MARVNAPKVVENLSKRDLGKVIQRTVEKAGYDASKRQLARRFRREAGRKLGWVRVPDTAIRD